MRSPTLVDLPLSPLGKPGWPWTDAPTQLADKMQDGSPWPRISIITPSYNQADFLEETIRSVLLQGYPNLEYILIDGGSTDGSLDIIHRYAPWLAHWVSEPDRGQSHAINKGFASCTGEIITWIATDDVYFPGAFEEVALRWSEMKEAGAVVGAFHFLDADSRLDPEKHHPHLPHPAPIDLSLTLAPWRLHQVSTFYTRHALDEVGRTVREDLRHNMDRELIYRIARKYPICLVERPLAAFRIHQRSKSWSYQNMITMAREYASIQAMFSTSNARENALRQKIARGRIAKGYLKFAKYNPSILPSVRAMFQALYYQPSMLFTEGYWKAWLAVLRLRSLISKFRKTRRNEISFLELVD